MIPAADMIYLFYIAPNRPTSGLSRGARGKGGIARLCAGLGFVNGCDEGYPVSVYDGVLDGGAGVG